MTIPVRAVRLPAFAGCWLSLLIVSPAASMPAAADTSAHPPHADSLAIARQDSVRRDSTQKAQSGIDSVVAYSATDSVIYALSNKTMYLHGNSDIGYKELGLKAENININWNTSVMHAEGVVDTADTAGTRFRGQPEMKDGGELYRGSTIAYNFKTKKGTIDLGKTEIEKGLYYGEEIKKVSQDVLFVKDGKFTTCDLEHPHYYFASPEMKVIVKDKVIARPVFLYIDDVPVFALPFGIFPSERGRRSGLIAPAYGQSDLGRYLLHLGYYWAMTDYTDWSLRGDGYSGGSWALYTDFNYRLRYFFDGGISAAIKKTITGERGDPNYSKATDFNISMRHTQDVDPTTHVVVNFTFASGSYYQNATTDFNDLLQQNIVSNATLTKTWEGVGSPILTMNIHRDQNITPYPSGPPAQTVLLEETLPSLSFSMSQLFPFRAKKYTGSGPASWYDLIGLSYASQFQNALTKTALDEGTHVDQRAGVQHTVTLSASPKVGYFTVSPVVHYTEDWYNKSIFRSVDPSLNDSLVTRDVKAFKAVRYYDVGLQLSTKLYGVFQPGVFGITGIRHQLTPSLSYTYQPDFSKPSFGYYGRYTDTSGVQQKYSYYEREVFGSPPGEESQSIAFRLGNVFEMKTAADDTSGKENKFQLLNVDLSSSYNFARDSLKFDEVGMAFRTNIGQALNIGGSSSFNLYKFERDPSNPQIGRRVNKFLLSNGGRLADMTNFTVSIGTRLSGEKHKTSAGPIKTEADSLAQARKGGVVGLYDQEAPDFSIPWNMDLTWNFSQNQSNPLSPFRTSVVSANLGFNLTEFWKITATSSYDILNRQFAAPYITVYRDLHCWEMNFSWVPTGFNRNFKLEIRLKAPQLQDVKVTKQESARGIF